MKSRNAVIGFAATMLLAFAAAPALAKGPPFNVKCKEKTANSVDLHGTDGSECFASSDGSGTAKANADGATSFADGEVQTGAEAKATARSGSFSEATSDTHGKSTSKATGGSSVTATSDHHGNAEGTATSGSEADASAFGACDAKATADGAGSLATADCESNGTHAQATATGGGTAKGFSNASPTCNPGASGTARVRSSGGNCG